MKLTIRNKLLLAFGVMLAFTVVVGLVGIHQTSLVRAARAGKSTDAAAYEVGDGAKRFDVVQQSLAALLKSHTSAAAAKDTYADVLYNNVLLVIGGITVVGILVGLLIAVLLSRN